MSHKLRNTLILGILLLIVILGGYFSNRKDAQKLSAKQKSFNSTVKMLEDLQRDNPDMKDEKSIVAALDKMKKEARENNKFILLDDNPTHTFEYLVLLCDKFCPEITFDFQLRGSGKIDEIQYNRYELSGIAHINSLFKLTTQLEKQNPLYTIESLIISQEAEGYTDTIDFDLTIQSHFYNQGTEYKESDLKIMEFPKIKYNPFYSRIHGPKKSEDELKFINLDNAVLIGLNPEKIFIRDNNGIVHILYIGDKVAYGYLSSINWNKQYANFKINKIGIFQNKKLYIEKE